MSARHHLVPQFYLRNFANGNQQLALVDRARPDRAIRNAVRKACSEVGFYRIETDVLAREQDRIGHDPEVVEHHLSQFERAAAPAIYKLIRTGLSDFTKEDWYHLINHIALQTVRGHRWREDFNAAATHQMRLHLGQTVTDEQIRAWLRESDRPITDEEVSAFRVELLGPKGPRLVAPEAVMVQESLKLALSGLGERLADGMHWTLIRSDEAPVLTSDEPVCWWSPGDGPVGYATANVVWFPLSPRLILQLRDRDLDQRALGLPTIDTAAGRDDLIRLINGQVGGQAHRWIIHHPDDRPLDRLQLAPRTKWGDQLVSSTHEGSTRRELWYHRRLPELDDGDSTSRK
ncbi:MULTISPECIES: DUF4238 domain-containing protein [Micrococcales]|uniref:DUF4238 domain-containing protein n=1 Tax=Sediminivirga luteola TaxID=1774748 RepID=A0A8J2TY87_9MICO|nr:MULTISPECIES: DUF4238 domain-containing protein [Micrococcales]GGA15852.1 hypothetical protein GCM10011333_18570 [Sediminivirga luteola]